MDGHIRAVAELQDLLDTQDDQISIFDSEPFPKLYRSDNFDLIFRVALNLWKYDGSVCLAFDRDLETAGAAVAWAAVGVLESDTGRGSKMVPGR